MSVSVTMTERLSSVLCALCGHPVSHYDRGVPGALAGGMCTRASCLKDRSGKPQRVYTFEVAVIQRADDRKP